jgi:phosphate transport system substrate-binding protein
VAGVIALPIDNNANGQADSEEVLGTKAKAMEMIANGKYPSPPARVEFLVTKGKPQGLPLAFIHWILTDGQKFVQEGGFIPLTTEMLNASLQKIS